MENTSKRYFCCSFSFLCTRNIHSKNAGLFLQHICRVLLGGSGRWVDVTWIGLIIGNSACWEQAHCAKINFLKISTVLVETEGRPEIIGGKRNQLQLQVHFCSHSTKFLILCNVQYQCCNVFHGYFSLIAVVSLLSESIVVYVIWAERMAKVVLLL